MHERQGDHTLALASGASDVIVTTTESGIAPREAELGAGGKDHMFTCPHGELEVSVRHLD